MKINKKGQLFLVSGSSGAGKTTIVSNAIQELSKQFPISKVVTYTTKIANAREVNGVDYFFISKEEFISKVKNNQFLEYSTDYGPYYGTSIEILNSINEGKHLICVTDIRGIESIKKFNFDFTTCIWIESSIEELKKRLLLRARDSIKDIEHRLEIAEKEIESSRQISFDFILSNNASLKSAIKEFESIVKNKILV